MWFSHEIQNAFYRAKLAGAKFFSIGSSTLGKHILCAHVGNKVGPQILVQAAIHAREHITTLLACRQIEYCLRNFRGIGGIYFVPLLNPDGVDIAINGSKNLQGCVKKKIDDALKYKDHRLFKANANLVDLNVNFDAKWGRGLSNVGAPSTENFIGMHPHSEAETRVITEFTKKIKPVFTISYHCKGEEIYYKFHQKRRVNKLHYAIAKLVAKQCGYPVKTPKGSVGGFKDYCVSKLNIPSVTIEVGSDSLTHPIGKESLQKILKEHARLPLVMLENFVRCDILLSWINLQTSRKKVLCALRYFKVAARQKKARCQ